MELFLQKVMVIVRDVQRLFSFLMNRHLHFGCSQNPKEQLMFCEYAKLRSPQTFMEIGTAEGGNAVIICQSIPSIKKFIGIDLYVRNRFVLPLHLDCKVFLKNGRSSSARVFAWAASKACKIDLLFIDGDHTYEGVKLDYDLYSQRVRKGGLIAFHDIVPDKRPALQKTDYKGGVPAFWNEIKQGKKYIEIIDDPNQDGMGIGVLEV